jgi:hypothetical protein
MTVARIAESYFQRLLYETAPASRAVGALSLEWGPRMAWTGQWLGLSRPEHQTEMVLIYVGEVGNGGHTQFFSNRGGEIATRVRAALREIGLFELLAALDRACALFPDSHVPVERREVDRLLDGWGEDRLTEIDRLDRMVWQLEPDPRLIAYLRENQSEVLRLERGLGAS